MKRLICFFAPLVLLIMVGCGGDDSVPPPPAPLTMDKPEDKQMLADLQNAALRAKDSCSQQYSPVFILMAAQMTQQKAQGQQPALPVMPQQSGGSCNNDIANLLLLFSTIRVPQPGNPDTLYAYLPESKEWLIRSVGRALVNSVGKSLQERGIPMTPDIVQSLYAVAIQHVNQNIKPGLPGQAQAVANTVGNGYGM